MSDKDALSPAKAISRWADTVNWILLNTMSINIPNHLRETLQEECLRIRAAVAHEQPPASPSVAHEQPPASPSVAPEQQQQQQQQQQQPSRRMKANPAEPTDTYHAREHNEIKECQAGRPCEPVDPPAKRRMKANPAFCQLYPEHAQEHNETPKCSFGVSCQPVDPPAPPGPAPTASAEELYNALRESLKLQRHYAELLNMNDGGQRRLDVFASPEAWIARLRETGDLPSAPDQSRDNKRSTT